MNFYNWYIIPVCVPRSKHRFCLRHFETQNLNLIQLNFILYHLYSYIMMVWTRSQLENLSKEELIEELINVEDISSKLSDLTSHCDDFLRQYELLSSELTVSKNCNWLLSERIVQLERNAVNNAQYHCYELLEINSVPATIVDVFESSICRAFCP